MRGRSIIPPWRAVEKCSDLLLGTTPDYIAEASEVSELLVDQAHKATLYGTQLTLRTLRQRYWILGARSLVKTRIRQCVICARHTATSPIQLMGDLPLLA